MAYSNRLQLRGAGQQHYCSSSEHGLRKFDIAVASFVFVLLHFTSTPAAGYAGKIGVDIELKYGSGIIPPIEIVRLLKFHAISRARLFDANVSMLQAFARSKIDLLVSVPNEDVPAVARSRNAARRWVADHIVPFPATKISAILVGYHWLSDRRLNRALLLPAIRNVNSALVSLGLTRRAIKVSTSSYMDLLSHPSWAFPPSLATFKPSLTPILRPLVSFLTETESFFDVDISPYYAYVHDPSVSLRFVLFERTRRPVRDSNTGVVYKNMFDFQLDAVNSALRALGSLTTESTFAATDSLKPPRANATSLSPFVNKENSGPLHTVGHGGGFPAGPSFYQHYGSPHGSSDPADLALDQIARRERIANTRRNAQIFNQNLINHVFIAKGTPVYPSQPITAYIFELFNEALRFGPKSEKHLGVFYPNGTSVYPIDFCSPYL